MEKWICKECGITIQGDESPLRCPRCGSNEFRKEPYEEKKSNTKLFVTLSVIIISTVLFLNFYACNTTLSVDNSVVTSLDLNRYLGKWYEVARFDHNFERDMTHCIATYTMQEDGTIKVTNQGRKDGKWKTSEGKGLVTNTPGVLRVSFFGPFYSDYRIMMVDSDYSYALVGGEDGKYLWILSRTPQLSDDTREELIREAQRRGYQTDNLIWVKQD